MEKLITAPGSEPISLAEAKAHLRVTSSDEDSLIGGLITAARQMVEHTTGRALITQTWELVVDEFPECDGFIRLPKAPLVSITSVKYLNLENVETTVSSGDYRLVASAGPFAERGMVGPAFETEWPSDVLDTRNAVTVRYVAGYGAAGDVPAGLKSAIYLVLGDLYANREAQGMGALSPNETLRRLLFPFKLLDL